MWSANVTQWIAKKGQAHHCGPLSADSVRSFVNWSCIQHLLKIERCEPNWVITYVKPPAFCAGNWKASTQVAATYVSMMTVDDHRPRQERTVANSQYDPNYLCDSMRSIWKDNLKQEADESRNKSSPGDVLITHSFTLHAISLCLSYKAIHMRRLGNFSVG